VHKQNFNIWLSIDLKFELIMQYMLVSAHEVSQHRPMCPGHADGHIKE
jgi:hypothetical protein